ncbi:MAG TPA: hypothetical protein VF998_06050 [Candidatus Limnocylindria bacterium]
MRVILQTAPILVERTIPNLNNGKSMEGTAYFVATVYDADDQAPLGANGEPDARPMSYWRSKLRPDQPFRIKPPIPGVPPIDIPRTLLDPLPDNARLLLSWRWAQNM